MNATRWASENVPVACWAWVIALVAGVSLASVAGPGTNQAPSSSAGRAAKSSAVRKVNVDEFEKLWQEKTNVVLDVRTKREFDSGHIPGARNLDVSAADFDQRVRTLDKGTLYLVHCGAGVRSARACERMSAMGFTNLVDLAPGFKKWESAGKKVER